MWDGTEKWTIPIAISLVLHVFVVVPLVAGRDERAGSGVGAGRTLAESTAAIAIDVAAIALPVIDDAASWQMDKNRDVRETGAIDGSPIEPSRVTPGQSADPVPTPADVDPMARADVRDAPPATPPAPSGMGAGRGATLPSFDLLPIPAPPPPPKPRAVAVQRAPPVVKPAPDRTRTAAKPARDLDAAYVPPEPPPAPQPPPRQNWLRRGIEASRSYSGPTRSADSAHGETSPAATAGGASASSGGGAGPASAGGAGPGAAGAVSAATGAAADAASAAAGAAAAAASGAASAAAGAAGAAAGAASGAAGAAAGAASAAAGAAAAAAGVR